MYTKTGLEMTISATGPGHDALEHALLAVWMDEADIGLCVVNSTCQVVMLNPAACRMLDVDGLQIINSPLQTLLRQLNSQPKLAQWLATPGFDGEMRLTRANPAGEPVELLLKCRSIRTSAAERFKVVAITDITAMVKAQNVCDQHLRQWQALNAGVVVSNALAPDMPIVYVNPAFERMSGYASADILGRNCRFLQGNDRQQVGLDSIRQAIRQQTSGYAVLKNYRKDGSVFLNELFISPVRDANGITTHFVGIQHLRASHAETGQSP